MCVIIMIRVVVLVCTSWEGRVDDVRHTTPSTNVIIIRCIANQDVTVYSNRLRGNRTHTL